MEPFKKVREFYYKHPIVTSLAITAGATALGAVIGDCALGRVSRIAAVETPYYSLFLGYRGVRPAYDVEFLNAEFGGLMGLISGGIPALATYIHKVLHA